MIRPNIQERFYRMIPGGFPSRAALTLALFACQPGMVWAAAWSDTSFANGDWSSQQLTVTGSTDPGATYASGQAGTGGNPGAYRETTQTYRGPNLGIAVAHWAANELYDPGVSGAIGGFSFSFDLAFFNYPGSCCGPSFAVGYAPLLVQNGNFFRGNSVLTVSPAWASFSLPDQAAADFVLVNGTDNPDFSAAGGPIMLGYITFNGTSTASETSTTSGLDNWVVSTVDIPEPASLGTLAAALTVLGAWRRRERRG